MPTVFALAECLDWRAVGHDPCLGFKVLAAGHRARRRESVEASFRYAYSKIKPGDAIIVGMFPRYRDEVAENVELARTVLSAT